MELKNQNIPLDKMNHGFNFALISYISGGSGWQ